MEGSVEIPCCFIVVYSRWKDEIFIGIRMYNNLKNSTIQNEFIDSNIATYFPTFWSKFKDILKVLKKESLKKIYTV